MYYVAHGVAVSNTHALMKMLPAPSLFVSQICLDEPVQNVKCLLNISTSVPSWFTPFGPFFPHDPGQTHTVSNFGDIVSAMSIIFGAYFTSAAHLKQNSQ